MACLKARSNIPSTAGSVAIAGDCRRWAHFLFKGRRGSSLGTVRAVRRRVRIGADPGLAVHADLEEARRLDHLIEPGHPGLVDVAELPDQFVEPRTELGVNVPRLLWRREISAVNRIEQRIELFV